MRLQYLVPLCLVAITPLAHADTFQFSYSGVSDSADCSEPDSGCTVYNISWQLPSTADATTSSSSTYNNVNVTSDYTPELYSGSYTAILTQPFAAQQNVDFYDGTGADDATLYSYQNFFSGPAGAPVFNPGSYGAGISFSDFSALTGTLTVTDLSTTTTPEPCSLALLGTGALGAVGALRRRLFTR